MARNTATKKSEEPTPTSNNSPVYKLRYGGVEAAVWKNVREGVTGEFFSVTLAKRFKQGDEWKASKSFDERDLPTVAKAANDAHTWIQGAKLPAAPHDDTE